jgi:hypothetical protein
MLPWQCRSCGLPFLKLSGVIGAGSRKVLHREGRAMSRTTPQSYYELFVVPNFEDYLRAPDDIRLGFNASVPAFQLAEVMHTFYRDGDSSKISQWPELKDFYAHLRKLEPAFTTIQSVANAYKHLRLKKSHYVIGSPGALWGLTLPSDEFDLVSSWDDRSIGDVIVQCRDGKAVSLTDALAAVVEDLWPSVLPAEI